MSPRVAVLLPMPFAGPLDYLVPDSLGLGPGDLVEVPLGPRLVIGCVWGDGSDALPEARLKPVRRRLDAPPLAEPFRRFLARAADYTMTPPGLMLRLAIRVQGLAEPPRTVTLWRAGAPVRGTPARARVLDALARHPDGLSTADLARAAGVGSGVIQQMATAGGLIGRAAAREAAFAPLFGQAPGRHLSPRQEEAAAALRADLGQGGFRPTLLRGVTGSGKTEVYLEAAAEAIGQGGQALVLLPEVALTPAFLARVEARFGVRPAEWHHAVPGGERRRVWRGAAEGAAKLVVGARSALFLPFRDLRLIVVDEEHEPSYKQEDAVLYHARDLAVLRAQIEGAAVVLASATPSLESWANAMAGRYVRIDLPDRFGRAVLPEIRLIDLRRERLPPDRWISGPLAALTERRLAAGEQTLFFLNRRGYAPLTLCRACGHRFACPDCDAWMVAHRFRRELVCHQCGRAAPEPTACPDCGRADRLAACGPGVERLAEEVAARWPGARIQLISSDQALSPAELKARLTEIAEGAADIVIGTQMVAKGHNFPKLTLVGVVDADLGLMGGDLRAAERTFQLIAQVAGRAGRAERPGVALLQTAAPDHPVMRAILAGDAEGFWRAEAAARQAAGSPPYGRMVALILSGLDEATVWAAARRLAQARALVEEAGAELFGPVAAPIARIRGRARVRLLVKAPRQVAVQPMIRAWLLAAAPLPGTVRVTIDVDPQSFL